MTLGGHIAAVILAAGRSSRMGATKSLLTLGSQTVLERAVETVLGAGVKDIVVVTGHEPERLAAVLAALPVRPVHNAHYDTGMFSSVRAGVAALDGRVGAFFIFPVDYPLVRAEVLERMMAACVPEGPGILHPTCGGRRGHPPLILGRYREALLRADDKDTLRAFLGRQAQDECDVEVGDPTILMDMDTEEDYRRMCRLAAILDAAPGSGCR